MPSTSAGTVFLDVKLNDKDFMKQMAGVSAEASKVLQNQFSKGLDLSSLSKDIKVVEKNITQAIDHLSDTMQSGVASGMEQGAAAGAAKIGRIASNIKMPKLEVELDEAQLRRQMDLYSQQWEAIDNRRIAKQQEIAQIQAEIAREAGSATWDQRSQENLVKLDLELAKAQHQLANLKMEAERADQILVQLERDISNAGKASESVKPVEVVRQGAASEARHATSQVRRLGTEGERAGRKVSREMMRAASNTNKLGRATDKVQGGFKKMLRYGLAMFGIRSLYLGIRKAALSVTDSFKHMASQNTTLASSLNSITRATDQMKGSFASAIAPLVEALIPVLIRVVEWLTKAFNAVALFFGALTGKESILIATGSTKAFLDAEGAIGGAASAAEKYKRTLAGFDELEILSFPSASAGSGSGGGSGTSGGSIIWEEVAIAPLTGDRDLASIINNWIHGIDAQQVGKQISDKIASALEAAYTFIEAIDWSGLGVKIGEGWNAIDWYTVVYNLGRTIFSTMTGLADLLAGWLLTTDWKAIGESIGTAISDLDWYGTINSIGRAIFGAFGGLANLLAGFFKSADWKEIGKSIGEAISDLDWAGTLRLIVDAIWISFSSIVQLLASLLSNTDWEAIGSAVWNALAGIDWKEIIINLANLIGSFFGAAFGTLWGLLKAAWDGVKFYWKKEFYDNGKLTFESFFEGINSTLGKGSKFFIDIATALLAGLLDALGLHTEADKIRNLGKDLGESFEKGFLQGMANLGTKMWNSIKTTFSDPFGVDSVLTKVFGPSDPTASTSTGGGGSAGRVVNPVSSPGGAVFKRYATGGVVKQPTLALIGEAGKEAVIPLERNIGWITELAGKIREEGGTGGGETNVTIPIYLGTDTLIGTLEAAIDREGRLRNQPVFS